MDVTVEVMITNHDDSHDGNASNDNYNENGGGTDKGLTVVVILIRVN